MLFASRFIVILFAIIFYNLGKSQTFLITISQRQLLTQSLNKVLKWSRPNFSICKTRYDITVVLKQALDYLTVNPYSPDFRFVFNGQTNYLKNEENI